MSRRTFTLLLQISFFLLFVIFLVTLVLIAEGYQYDPVSKNIVKKAIIAIENTDFEGVTVTVDDKKITPALAGEIRVSPGTHTIALSRPGYFSWIKKVTVPEDTVVRFPPVLLFPLSIPETMMKPIAPSASWKLRDSLENGFFIENRGLHVGKYYPYSNLLRFKVYDLTVDLSNLIFADENGTFVGSADNSVVWANSHGVGTPFTFSKLYPTHAGLFALDSKNHLWEVPSNPPHGQSRMLFTVPRNFKDISSLIVKDGFIAISFKENIAQKLPELFIVYARHEENPKSVFQLENAQALFLDQGTLWYQHDKSVVTYDLINKKEIKSSNVDFQVNWLSRIEDTFHVLALSPDLVLKYCDIDFENCHTVATLDSPRIDSSKEGNIFVLSYKGAITLLNFRADSRLPEIFRQLISYIESIRL